MGLVSGLKSSSRSPPPVKKKPKKKKMSAKENKEPKVFGQSKICTTLQPFLEIHAHPQFKGKNLYSEFERYMLTSEQLILNDYPIEHPDQPGHILTRVTTYPQNPECISCSRCRHTFSLVNGEYKSESLCFYHYGRRLEGGIYSCCDKDRPCQLGFSHVTADLPLKDLIFKKIEAKKQVRATQMRKIYALDCEMVYTTIGMEVAKVSLVDVEGKAIYDTLVLPQNKVLDFNTKFSGITEKDMVGLKITFDDVQAFLLKTINKDTILVGHALQNDLKVLRLIHNKCVDTQVVFRDPGSFRRKKLKLLVKDTLGYSIQDKKVGHDSMEDARACMELMLHKIHTDIGLVQLPSPPKPAEKEVPTFYPNTEGRHEVYRPSPPPAGCPLPHFGQDIMSMRCVRDKHSGRLVRIYRCPHGEQLMDSVDSSSSIEQFLIFGCKQFVSL